MRGFLDRIEKMGEWLVSDNGILGFIIMVLWPILDFWFVLSLPEILSGGNPSVRESISQGILGFQVMIGLLFILLPLYLVKNHGGFKGFGGGGGRGKGKKYGDQGTAKKGTVSDLKELTDGDPGLRLSKKIRLSAKKSYEHIAIIGPTGSGKSTSYFIPNLLDQDGSHSVVVTDPKGELCDITSPYLRSIGYEIVKLVPLEPKSNKYTYNPILIADDSDDLGNLAQLILTNGGKAVELKTGSSSGGAEWVTMSVPLFAAALIYVKSHGKKKTIDEAIQLILSPDSTLKKLEATFKEDEEAYKKFLLFNASAGSEKTMSSIKSVFASNIQLFTNSKVIEFTRTPFVQDDDGVRHVNERKVFRPQMLREKSTALFICVPEIQSTDMMPLMSVVYTQLMEKCMLTKKGQGIYFLLDEFANIGIVPTISNIAATARSRNISLSLGLQGVEQMERNYGKENAADLLNNLKTKLAFSGLTGDSAKYISDLAGVTTIETVNFSKNPTGGQDPASNIMGAFTGGQTSVSRSGARRELITPDEVRRMEEDEVLVIAHNKDAVFDKKNVYYKQKKYMDRINAFKE